MRRILLLALLAAAAPAGPVEELLGGETGVLAVRDREILQADEKRKAFFREDDPFLLPAVREALDDPLGISAGARAIAPGHGLRATLRALDPWEEHAEEIPQETEVPEGLEAVLEPRVVLAVAEVASAALRAHAVATRLGGEDRDLLRTTLPEWVARSTEEDRKSALAGEEDVEGRERMMRCAAVLEAANRESLRRAWIDLVTVVEARLPDLAKQPELKRKPLVLETEEGPILIRFHGNDGGDVDALLVIDFGGDDEYKLPAEPADRPVRVVIDLGGNDLYLSNAPFSWGGALLGCSLLVDVAGDDDYRGGDWSLGAGLAGCGALWDLAGNDRYYGGLGAQGVGIFGSGLLLDDAGDDEYVADCFCQGFASTGGLGAIVDRAGDDAYTAGREDEDIWRRQATYITFAQGSAYGHRFGHVLDDGTGPRRWEMTGQLPGGVGLLLDGGGNDRYEADVFGQGSAYWYSLGLLVDGGGNDRYRATWYGQGVGTHAAAGAVIDLGGDDWYFSRNTSQGCGHDFSVGLLHDLGGNDRYAGTTLCQGAGNAFCGLGMLLDDGGDDSYRCQVRCWGFGSEEKARPDAAPYGFFVDLGGTDRFDGPAVHQGERWRQGERGYGVDR